MSALKIKKGLVTGLANWLNELSLSGKQSRERSKFVSTLTEAIRDIENDRMEIVKKYAIKEEDGSLKVNEVDGKRNYELLNENVPLFEKEYTELLSEEFTMDILESNRQRFMLIRELVLETEYKFGPSEGDEVELKIAKIRQAAEYAEWCDAFTDVTL